MVSAAYISENHVCFENMGHVVGSTVACVAYEL
jgi:hypothetical protein